jgi:soluble lytic murein transglycosylase-like protein
MRRPSAPRRVARLIVAAALIAGGSTAAYAERLTLTTGRILVVKGYRTEGELMTVLLPNGGEATFNASIVVSIAPDEARPEPVAPPAPAPTPEPPMPRSAAEFQARPFAQLISNVAARHGVEPALVHAVIKAESNYEPRARSGDGARGLMQVMPATGREFGIRNLYDPHANLEAGVQYLKSLLGRFTLSDALAAYNAGPAVVKRYGGMPPFRETQDYVRRVLADFTQ